MTCILCARTDCIQVEISSSFDKATQAVQLEICSVHILKAISDLMSKYEMGYRK